MSKIWELKQSVSDPDTLEMYIYGDIKAGYYDWWNDEEVKSETSANFFREELAKYSEVKNINLYCNSYGGSVYEAMAIRNQLKRHGAIVTGYVDGFAASAMSFILTACDKVIMYSNTMQMLHNMWTSASGNATQLRKAADDLDVMMQGNRQAYLEKAGDKLTEEKLIEILENETWLTAEQCLGYGLCDEVLAKEVDLTNAKQLMQKVNKTFEQQLSYNKALAAQARELAQRVDPTPPKGSDNADPIPGEPKENKTIKLMAALFAKREM